jgi:hypothetical protein
MRKAPQPHIFKCLGLNEALAASAANEPWNLDMKDHLAQAILEQNAFWD